MNGPVLFVELKAGVKVEPALLCSVLGIDAYRARSLVNAGAPFVAGGAADLGAALRMADAFRDAGVPASAHDGGVVAALPAPKETVSFAERPAFAFRAPDGTDLPLDPSGIRCLVHGKIRVEVDRQDEGRAGAVLLGGNIVTVPGKRPEPRSELRHYFRLEVFVERGPGRIERYGIRHDGFDYAALGPRKTLAAVRNLEALRDALARAAGGATGGAAVDDAFHRTELSRGRMDPDEWTEYDLGRGASRTVAVRSNRRAYDFYARVRFLHEMARRPESANHFLEL